MNPRVVVALNMYDELEASGAELDYDSLGRMLGVPMVPVVARHGPVSYTHLDVYKRQSLSASVHRYDHSPA